MIFGLCTAGQLILGNIGLSESVGVAVPQPIEMIESFVKELLSVNSQNGKGVNCMCRLRTSVPSLLLLIIIVAVIVYLPAIRRYIRIHTM